MKIVLYKKAWMIINVIGHATMNSVCKRGETRMSSTNLRNNVLEFTPTLGTQLRKKTPSKRRFI